MADVPWFSLLTMVTLSATLSFMADAQDCFGGIETFEKMVSMTFSGVVSYKSMLQQPGQAITRDCVNLCKQQASCLSFGLNYNSSTCISYSVNSINRDDDLIRAPGINFFEKICFRGVSKQAFDSACRDRLWVFDRVRDAYLDGHVDKEVRNVRTKEDCEKLCITEERFKCRSADYDEIQHICRMSRETRRTKPLSFKQVPGSSRNYLENQCAPPPPGTCRYDTKNDVTVFAPDYLQFAASAADCMAQCDAETAFSCWSYSYVDNRCQLSGDSTTTWGKSVDLPNHPGAIYGELICFFEQCDNGVMTFEKMTGFLLRSAQGSLMPVSKPGSLGNSLECIQRCLDEGMECPAFSDQYQNMRCDRLDRNSNGRTNELIARDGESYFEKICLKGPEAQACSDKAWAFERALGYELVASLYSKTIEKVEGRRECIQLCLGEREFTCRSARYDEDTGECKLSPADRRSEPGKYFRSEDSRVSYLENSCIDVVQECAFVETPDAYATYTNVIITEGITTMESCRELCVNFEKFPCRSFSYFSSSLQCFLSGDDKASAGSAAIQRRPGIVYNERMCPQTTTTILPSETTHSETELTITSSLTTFTFGLSANTQAQFQEKTTLKPKPPYQAQEPQRFVSTGSECSPTERLIFEKLTGYEPFGATSNLLYRGDSTTPGITAECIRRCQALSDCRSFVLDHRRFECSSVQDPPSIHPGDFRPAIGKTYFGGICVPAYLGCSKLWVYERVSDHELQGLLPLDVVRVVSLEQCQQHCLETRKYVCRSANYFHLRRECHIFGDDRTAAKSQLVGASRVDFFENQCLVETSYCPYQKTEPDLSMIYITKSLSDIPSTLHCERECNREREFNCRSYTFWSLGGHGSLCMLSGESRITGQAVGLQYRQGASFASKICKVQSDSRQVPAHTMHPQPQLTTKEATTTTPRRITTLPPYKPFPPSHEHIPPPPLPPPHPPPHPLPPAICTADRYTYEKVVGYDVHGGRKERISTRVPLGVVQPCHIECQRLGERCLGFVIQYRAYQECFVVFANHLKKPDLVPSEDSVYFEKVCLREHTCSKLWAFDRVLHYELLAEPIRVISDVEERTDCEDLCLHERPDCLSATYHHYSKLCQLFSDTRRSAPSHFHHTDDEVEYLESQCISDAPTCQYRDFPDRFLPNIDRLTRAFSLQDCQRKCDGERLFTCRSINFETVARDCALSSEDLFSVSHGLNALQPRRNSIYSEKGNCEQVSVQCNQQDMLLTIHFESPFHGRVYAKGNPSQCYVVGTGQTTLQFAISLGSRCGTRPEGREQFVNEVVVQQHPVIMTDHDRTIKVVCSFETRERTYTMSGPGVGAVGMNVARTHNQVPITAIVTNTAPPPNVAMRVLDLTGRDARSVGLGDELILRIEMREPSSAFAIFARNLYARSSNGESLFLIDSSGCPTDPTIFPPLELDSHDKRSLQARFKAFRFPSTGMVNFEVQIRFCQEKCEQVRCGVKGTSFGRKKRDTGQFGESYADYLNGSSRLDDDDVYFDQKNYDSIRAVVEDRQHSVVFMPSDEQNKEKPLPLITSARVSHNRNENSFIGSSSPSTEEATYQEAKEQHTVTAPSEIITTLSSFSDASADGTTEKYTEHYHVETVSLVTLPSPSLAEGGSERLDEFSTPIQDVSPSSESSIWPVSSSSSADATYSDSVKESSSNSDDLKFRAKSDITANMFLTSNGNTDSPNTNQEQSVNNNVSKEKNKEISVTSSLEEKTGNETTYTTVSDKATEDHQSIKFLPMGSEHSITKNFSRKFAFMKHDDSMTNSSDQVVLINATDVNYDLNNKSARDFPRPDLRGFGSQPNYYRPNRFAAFENRKYSTLRPAYSSPNSVTLAAKPDIRRKEESLPFPPLPQTAERYVGDSNAQAWDYRNRLRSFPQRQPPASYPLRPVEISNVPNVWQNNYAQNSDVQESRQNNGPTSHQNENVKEGRQVRISGANPNYAQRPVEIQNAPNTWGSQSSPAVHIQMPFQVVDGQRERHPGYRPYQSRPQEIPGPVDPSHYYGDQSRNLPQNNYGVQMHGNDANAQHPPNMPTAVNGPTYSNQRPNSQNPSEWSLNNNWRNYPQSDSAQPQGAARPNIYPQVVKETSKENWRDAVRHPNSGSNGATRNNIRPQPNRYAPNEVIATTQKTVPEEVPLSLAILVGEDGKSQNSNQQNQRNKNNQFWRPPHQYNRGLQRHNIINTPRPEETTQAADDKVCTSKATIIATAVSVTLVYLGIVAGAFIIHRWYRKNKRRKSLPASPIHRYPPNPASANVTYSTPDVTFRNVYGNFPVSSTSTT